MSIQESNIPKSWTTVGFNDATETISDNGLRVKQKDYLPVGSTPVIDQGEGLIGGYTNRTDARIEAPLPIIVFGDHTRRFKYVTFPFAVGADGVKLLQATAVWNPNFLFYQLNNVHLEDRGYGRHFQYLRKLNLVLPPLNEQIRIVEKLEELFSDLDAGVAEL
ncbi:MAG: restriction endonuclease subunit S, partial [Verrucomicrobia bacterium]|nr:restriction endonuclease subunit S [Deltaproteobacteria bacterium]